LAYLNLFTIIEGMARLKVKSYDISYIQDNGKNK